MNFAARTPGQTTQDKKQRHYTASGWVTPGIVGMICLVLVAASIERGRGNLQKLRTRVNPPLPTEVLAQGPGGQEPIHLTRSATNVGQGAELLSVTLLPGRGMNVFQITAMVPGHGEVPLLVSPPLADAANILSGINEDASGVSSTTLGGAILLPWAQRLSGTPSYTPGMLETTWQGKHLAFPAAPRSDMSVEGLFLNRGADYVKSDVLPDGQSALATFNAANFSGNWPSNVTVTVLAELTPHAVDITVTAQNVGSQATPFGIGWHPYLAIPSGKRADASLIVPSQTIAELDHRTGLPTGKMTQVDDTARDYSHVRGTRLGTTSIDDTYTSLESGPGSGPVAELIDPSFNLRVKVIPLTANISNMRVYAPADKSWVSIGPNTNMDDPFGAEWGSPERAGMTILAPGQSLRWKVRLEVSLIGSSTSTE